MVEVGSFTIGILEGVVAGLIMALISLIGGWVYSSRFKSVIISTLNYIFDTKIQVELVRVDRYAISPERDITMELFHEITEVSSSVTFEALSNSVLRIQGTSLPSPLEIRIEEEPAIDEYPSDDSRYEVRVKTYPSLSFGYRTDSSLKEFEVLSERITAVLRRECFNNQEPVLSFIEGEITDHFHGENEIIEIPNLNLRAKVQDDRIRLTIGEPRYLRKGIRKFIRPDYRA